MLVELFILGWGVSEIGGDGTKNKGCVKYLLYFQVLLSWVDPQQDISLETKDKQAYSVVATG